MGDQLLSYDWRYNLIIIVPWNLRQEANWLASKVDFDTGGDKTFGSAGFSATGAGSPTHTGCSTAIPKACDELVSFAAAIRNNDASTAIDELGTLGMNIKAKIQEVMSERGYTKNQIWNAIKQCRFWLVNHDGALVGSTGNTAPGTPFSFQAALTEMGLQQISSGGPR